MNRYKKLLIKNTFLICLAFSFLFSLSFHAERYSFSKASYTRQAEQSVKLISKTLDDSFSKLQDLSVLFNENDIFSRYVESDSPTPTQRKNLSKYLFSVINSMPTTTSSVFITQPNDNYVVSGSSLMDASFFAKSYGFALSEVLDLTSSENTIATPVPHVFFTRVDENFYFTVAIRNDTYFDGSYVIFSIYNMKDILKELPENTSLLISQPDSPLYCSGDFTNEQLRTVSSGKEIPGYTAVTKYSSITAMFGNLTYTLIIPESLYYSHFNRHLTITALLFVLLLMFSVIFSRRISKKTYSPIDRLVTQVSEISSETSESEIEAISSVISLLDKRNSELNALVENSRVPLKEKFLNDFIHGHLTEEGMCQGIELYLPDIEDIPPLYAVIVGTDSDYDTTFEDTENLHSYYEITNALLKHAFEDSTFFHMSTITPFVFAVVISCDDINSLTQKLKNLFLNIEVDFGISFQSTISEEIIFWKKLPQLIMSTYYRHTSNRLSNVTRTVTTAGELNFAVIFSPELENEIYTSCVRHNKEKLHSALDLLLKENFSDASAFSEIRSQLSTLLHALCVRVCAFTGINLDDVFGNDSNIYHEMKHSKDFAEFSNTIYHILDKISDEVKNLHSIDEHNYSKSMLEYIHQNYQRDVSLYDLATYMNMSQAYVSRLFKKLTNYNFKDYLAKIRIEKATALLTENPFTSIQDIAAMVGYNNAKPFTALFIKTMGISPTEYRKMHKKN